MTDPVHISAPLFEVVARMMDAARRAGYEPDDWAIKQTGALQDGTPCLHIGCVACEWQADGWNTVLAAVAYAEAAHGNCAETPIRIR